MELSPAEQRGVARDAHLHGVQRVLLLVRAGGSRRAPRRGGYPPPHRARATRGDGSDHAQEPDAETRGVSRGRGRTRASGRARAQTARERRGRVRARVLAAASRRSTGMVRFRSSTLGEFWYAVDAHAQPAETGTVPEMRSEVGGEREKVTLSVDNPLDEEVTLDVAVATTVAISESILRGSRCPRSARTSSRWGVRAESTRRVGDRGHHRDASRGGDVALGRLRPRRRADAHASHGDFRHPRRSGRVRRRFPNPFGDDETVTVRLETDEPAGVFELLTSRRKHAVPGFGVAQFPFDSAPSEWRDTTRRSWWRRLAEARAATPRGGIPSTRTPRPNPLGTSIRLRPRRGARPRWAWRGDPEGARDEGLAGGVLRLSSPRRIRKSPISKRRSSSSPCRRRFSAPPPRSSSTSRSAPNARCCAPWICSSPRRAAADGGSRSTSRRRAEVGRRGAGGTPRSGRRRRRLQPSQSQNEPPCLSPPTSPRTPWPSSRSRQSAG